MAGTGDCDLDSVSQLGMDERHISIRNGICAVPVLLMFSHGKA
jgi:hypothetical protein